MLIFLPFMKLAFKTSKKLYGQFTKTRLKCQEKNRKMLGLSSIFGGTV